MGTSPSRLPAVPRQQMLGNRLPGKLKSPDVSCLPASVADLTLTTALGREAHGRGSSASPPVS